MLRAALIRAPLLILTSFFLCDPFFFRLHVPFVQISWQPRELGSLPQTTPGSWKAGTVLKCWGRRNCILLHLAPRVPAPGACIPMCSGTQHPAPGFHQPQPSYSWNPLCLHLSGNLCPSADGPEPRNVVKSKWKHSIMSPPSLGHSRDTCSFQSVGMVTRVPSIYACSIFHAYYPSPQSCPWLSKTLLPAWSTK